VARQRRGEGQKGGSGYDSLQIRTNIVAADVPTAGASTVAFSLCALRGL